MKTILKRAQEWCAGIINRLDTSDLQRGYVQGAVEQKRISIDIFKQWLTDNPKITYDEENRTMLAELLKRLED